MSLLYPLSLGMLVALPIILWLHLRRRRPRRVLVPALAPWLHLAAAAPPRRKRVPPSLLLLMHLLAAALLGLAAAGPRLAGKPGQARDRALVLDLSASMTAEGRWAEAQRRAETILAETLGTRTLVAMGARPRVLVARDPDGRLAAAALARLQPAPDEEAALSAALALARAAAGPSAEILVLGDAGLGPPPSDSPSARLLTLGGPAENRAILSAVASRGGGETRLFARAANFGFETSDLRLRAIADGRELEARAEGIAPGDSLEAVWTLPAAAQTVELLLDAGPDSPADALPMDDRAQPAIDRVPHRVQLIGQSPALERALEALPGLELERVGMADYHGDGSVALSVVVGALPDPAPPGPLLWVLPQAGGPLTLRAEAAVARIEDPGTHPLVAGLELVGLSLEGLGDPEPPDWAESILEAGDRVAILAGSRDASRMLVLAFDPDAGALSGRLAFPILIARALAWLSPDPGGAAPLAPAEHDLRAEAEAWPAAEADAGADTAAPGGRPLWPALATAALAVLMLESALRAGWIRAWRSPRLSGFRSAAGGRADR